MVRRELGHRFAVLRDDERSACAGGLIRQGKAFGFELRGIDVAEHWHVMMIDMLVCVIKAGVAKTAAPDRFTHPTSTLRNCHGSAGSMFSGNNPGRPVSGVQSV